MRHASEDPDEAAPQKRPLAENVLSLAVVHAANLLVPLLTLPYLVRILGPELFGLIAFASAVVAYFMLVTDYAFDVTATQQIAKSYSDPEKVAAIFAEVLATKCILTLLGFALLAYSIFLFPLLRQHWELYVATYTMAFGRCLLPSWFFYGTEDTRALALSSLLSKLIFAAGIFVFVTESADFLLVPLFAALGWLIAAVPALAFASSRLKAKPLLPSVSGIKRQLLNGWHVFFSSVSVSVYTTTLVVVLGAVAGNEAVGYFTSVERIITAAKSVSLPVTQAIFPSASEKFSKSKQQGMSFVWRMAKSLCLVMLLVSIVLFAFAEPIVLLVLGPEFQSSVLLLQIMAFVPFVVSISNMLGVQTMLNLNYRREFGAILLAGAVLGIFGSLVFSPIYGEVAAASVSLVVETLVTLFMGAFLLFKVKGGIAR
ncbi:MAG: flippase [Congregibacter sp.]